MERGDKEHDLATQIKVYNQVLDRAGRGAGIDFFDKVVVPFVLHLASVGQIPNALQSLDRAKRTLHVEPGQQREVEMTGLSVELKSGKTKQK